MGNEANDLGNLATVKADASPEISEPESPADVHTQRDFNDNEQLARLGKRQVLRRNFGFMSILGFSCTILITWEAITVLFAQGLLNGGTAGVIYSYIIVWIGNLSVFSTMCELVSMAPTSGGQYHWVAMLAPRWCARYLSFLTGWLAVGGWQGSVASSALLVGNMIAGLISMHSTTYVYQPWHGTLLFWAVFLFAAFINTLVSSALPKFEGLILILHILGFFGILIPLLVLGPSDTTAEEVFSTATGWNNGGNWPTQGLSFMVGMLGNVFAFVGTDAAFHMAEETHNPSVVVPKSIIMSIFINGSCGLAMLFAMVFRMGGMDGFGAALQTGPGMLQFPFMTIFLNATNSLPGATFMVIIIVVLGACATVGMLASTSRVFWSFARDRGLPFWPTLSKIDPRTTVPVYAVGATAVISVLLSLINIGSAIAFQSVVSLSITCLYMSYFIAGSLLLYRRCTNNFAMPSSEGLPALANGGGNGLVWGPFHLPGFLGIANNIFTLAYLLVIGFFSFWPTMNSADPTNINFSVLVTGSIVVFSTLYYVIWAKKEYNGPIVEM